MSEPLTRNVALPHQMKISLLLIIALSAAGCYPLPSPTYSVRRYGLDAVLLDTAAGQPLRRKNVSIVIDGAGFTRRTSNSGGIRVPAAKNRYWTWLGGPAWASAPDAVIEIEADGFEPLRIDWKMAGEPYPSTKDGRIQAGRVMLKAAAEVGSSAPAPGGKNVRRRTHPPAH